MYKNESATVGLMLFLKYMILFHNLSSWKFSSHHTACDKNTSHTVWWKRQRKMQEGRAATRCQPLHKWSFTFVRVYSGILMNVTGVLNCVTARRLYNYRLIGLVWEQHVCCCNWTFCLQSSKPFPVCFSKPATAVTSQNYQNNSKYSLFHNLQNKVFHTQSWAMWLKSIFY